MILSRRYLMFAFTKANNNFLYSPRYIDWKLKEVEIKYNPSIIRLGLTIVKRPIVGYRYEIEGKIYQKSFYELIKQSWNKIWCGVFVREYLNIQPIYSRASGFHNFYLLTGEIIFDFDTEEASGFSENGIDFKIIFKQVWEIKRPLWLAVAKFPEGDAGVISLDVGAYGDPPRTIEYFPSGIPDGTIFANKNYAGLTYVFDNSHWETLPAEYYTTFNTTDNWDESELNIGRIAPSTTIEN